MSIRQKAFIVRIRPESTHGLDELNVQLGRGWRVVEVSPMGGAGVGSHESASPEICLAALVVAERREDADEAAAEAVAQAEEETEEVVEEIVRGEELSSEELSEELEEERNGGGT
jgi:hypothetical protein